MSETTGNVKNIIKSGQLAIELHCRRPYTGYMPGGRKLVKQNLRKAQCTTVKEYRRVILCVATMQLCRRAVPDGTFGSRITCKTATARPDAKMRVHVAKKRNALLAPSISTNTPHATRVEVHTANDPSMRARRLHRSWYLRPSKLAG